MRSNSSSGYVYPLANKENVNTQLQAQPISAPQEKKWKQQIYQVHPKHSENRLSNFSGRQKKQKKRFDTDFLNKKLAPVKLEICQAHGLIQRKMDELIDATDLLNKAVQKLKDLSV
ncbi:hypothetical protein ACFQUX_08415 [Pantoea stewartii]